jgi:CheY-like chemotaxis protein
VSQEARRTPLRPAAEAAGQSKIEHIVFLIKENRSFDTYFSAPNLIVMDLSMPIMNGLQAAPELKRMLPTVPIFLFTLYGSEDSEQAASSAGITAVVSKNAALKLLVDQAQDLPEPREPDSQSGNFRLSRLRPIWPSRKLDSPGVVASDQPENGLSMSNFCPRR